MSAITIPNSRLSWGHAWRERAGLWAIFSASQPRAARFLLLSLGFQITLRSSSVVTISSSLCHRIAGNQVELMRHLRLHFHHGQPLGWCKKSWPKDIWYRGELVLGGHFGGFFSKMYLGSSEASRLTFAGLRSRLCLWKTLDISSGLLGQNSYVEDEVQITVAEREGEVLALPDFWRISRLRGREAGIFFSRLLLIKLEASEIAEK